MSPLPDYVERHSRLLARGPYVQTGCKLTSFVADGRLQNLMDVCNRWFNTPSGGAVQYLPLTDKVFVSFADMASVQSGDPDDKQRGKVAEKDVTMWLLLLRMKPFHPIPRWFPIHLFVDSAPALITGREVFGFPKEIGRVAFPDSFPANAPFACKTFGFQHPVDPTQFGDWFRILEARPLAGEGQAGGEGGLEVAFQTVEQLFAHLVEQIFELGLPGVLPAVFSLIDLQSLWPSGLMRMVFLKQFPDTADNTKAVYQAIVETNADVTQFRGGGFHGDWELDVQSLGSHPMQTELGIAPGFQACGPAMWLDFDFVVQPGEVVWKA